MDAGYEPSEMETRTLFGLQMEQKRNNAVINKEVFSKVVSKKQEVETLNIIPTEFFDRSMYCAVLLQGLQYFFPTLRHFRDQERNSLN